MTRFQKLAAASVLLTLVLVTVGVIVRATGSGMGCPDWPLCHGQIIPPLDDYKAWIEWIHRGVAVVIGFAILALAYVAVRDHRDRASLLWPSLGALGLVIFQAWLGRETVRMNNSGESVTAHLAAAMALVGLLVFILVRAAYPARIGGRGASQRFTLLAAFAALSVFALLLFGSHVTATSQWFVFPDWPLMNGSLFPELTDDTSAHVLHRWIAIVVGFMVAAVVLVAWRTQRHNRTLTWLATALAVLYPVQAVIGGLQILTGLDGWTQTLHLALGALIWAALVGLAATSYYSARTAAAPRDGDPARLAGRDGGASDAEREGGGETAAGARGRGQSVRAYIALTKPRIIELLLVTTVPAMVLATREVPGIQLGHWLWLTVWTLVGGTLAAGSANAINCYIDRDIDELMARTRRRPLPAHQVDPDRAVVFGLLLGVVSFAVLAWFVNLLAAFLALLAIGFYVVVYTILMKRTTPQNIVIGGAAGALPPVIGWAAVTGDIGVPALLLFALVFYWTPPHFWALSLRIRRDYAAAGVPMLPVVRGIPETTRQIALYTVLMVAISLVLWAVARMGWIYLVAAVVLGAIFLRRAWTLWRQGASEEGSTAGAIRLYRFSISYLTLLFAAVAIDALVAVPLG
ncbi:MAG TPA: heme o synthase [Candidatus Limnocylindrales bacterium]|nr:heme o synthase [Candidatus Limnocylindrales bacterium]